jgi:hypothetical protein
MNRTERRIVRLIAIAIWVLAIVTAYEIGKWFASQI